MKLYAKLDLGNITVCYQNFGWTEGNGLLTVLTELKMQNFVVTNKEEAFETAYKGSAGETSIMNSLLKTKLSFTGAGRAIPGTDAILQNIFVFPLLPWHNWK